GAGAVGAVVEVGCAVVAPTSSGVWGALGWADGEGAPADEMFAAIARLARVVDVPVTADIEAGYGLPPEEIVRRLLAAGAVGCNLEDTDHASGKTLRDAATQAHWLAA